MNSPNHREFLAAARKHIRAFTWYGTYPEACALVMGYDNGLGPGSFVPGFQQWLTSRQGSAPEVVFWVHVLREALPNRPGLDGSNLSKEDHSLAVDKLFELLLEYVDEAGLDARATD